MSKLKRYDLTFDEGMKENPTGYYVDYADYQKLQSERDKLREAVKNTIDCFEAANIEGLQERLDSVPKEERFPGSLYDLMTRRLLHDVVDKCNQALNP